ncbi:MAG: tRNA lysidine(34) synthetase TilS [Campylobacterales bacterium]
MIDPALIATLRSAKNLLAFSAGVDSTALFHLLVEAQIPFDAALVNYQTRPQSDLEAEHARQLCQNHAKRFYTKTVTLPQTGFEQAARQVRYGFFEEIIAREGYTTLLTAHQLNDWVEWFLMQSVKGAGFFELCGMRVDDERPGYRLLRPLLGVPRADLKAWLDGRGIVYFEDSGNDDRRYVRNRFRQDYVQPLMAQHAAGLAQTFAALQRDRLRFESEPLVRLGDLSVLDASALDVEHQIDLAVKRLGFLPSRHERLLLARKQSGVYAHGVAVAWAQDRVFVSPYLKGHGLGKPFREQCRLAGIPPLTRGYLFKAGVDPRAFCRHESKRPS